MEGYRGLWLPILSTSGRNASWLYGGQGEIIFGPGYRILRDRETRKQM